MSYRRNDIKYRRNEAFVDVIENVNFLMSATGILSSSEQTKLISGTPLRADVSGQIMMRAYLSGTPECRFGLNDSLLFDASDQLPSLGYLPCRQILITAAWITRTKQRKQTQEV
jgi:Adaptor complexes medium subunit family